MDVQLQLGDVSRSKTFNLVMLNNSGGRFTAGFKPPRGHEFITMVVGDVPVGGAVDLDKMLAEIGLVANDKGAKEILMLKQEIEELKKQLAEQAA